MPRVKDYKPLTSIVFAYALPMDLLLHLRFFVAVADERHFGRAANALAMTQPPLSQGIQRLERHLAVRLFDRGPKGVRITDAGSALLPHAHSLLHSATLLTEEAAAWTPLPSLRIGIASDVEDHCSVLLRALTAAGLHITPHLAGSVELTDNIRSGELDLALVRHPGVIDGAVARPVHHLPTHLHTPATSNTGPSHPADIGKTILPMAVPPRRHHPAAHDQTIDTLHRLGHPGTTIEEPDPLVRRALVASGNAVRLGTDITTGAPITGDPFPLRLRVILPVPADRRPDLDHELAAATLEQSLS